MRCDRSLRLVADSVTSSTVDRISTSGLNTKPEMSLTGVDVANAVGGLALEVTSNEVCAHWTVLTVLTYFLSGAGLSLSLSIRPYSPLWQQQHQKKQQPMGCDA